MMECKMSEKLAIRPWIYTGRQETFSTVLASVSVSLSMPACNAEAEFSASLLHYSVSGDLSEIILVC